MPEVRVFERTSEMLRYLKSLRAGPQVGLDPAWLGETESGDPRRNGISSCSPDRAPSGQWSRRRLEGVPRVGWH